MTTLNSLTALEHVLRNQLKTPGQVSANPHFSVPVQCMLKKCIDPRFRLDSPEISHTPHNRPQPSNLDSLLMPAKKHAHSSSNRFVRRAWPRPYLAESTGGLWNDAGRTPRPRPRRSGSHAFVPFDTPTLADFERKSSNLCGFPYKYFTRTSKSSLPPSDP